MTLLFRITGMLIFITSISFYGLYLLGLLGYNFTPQISQLNYYALATFGAVGICWSLLLFGAQYNHERQAALALPSALGFGLLAFMRLLTLTNVEDVLVFIPIYLATTIAAAEALLFSLLAGIFFWAHRALLRTH